MQKINKTDPENYRGSRSQEQTIIELCEQFNIDLDHARQVASNAAAIFNHLQKLKVIRTKHVHLLEAAALLHDIGSNVKIDHHHLYGRDLILKHKLNGFNQEEQSILAFLIAMHRKNVKTKKIAKQIEKAKLAPEHQESATQMAAILRIADGLDHSHSQTTRLDSVEQDTYSYIFKLNGPKAKSDARRALQKSDLWTYVLKRPVQFVLNEEKLLLPGPRWSSLSIPAQSLTAIEISANDFVPEAAKKIFTFHFVRMIQHELGAIAGEVESVHDMRVAIRRMRSLIRVLKPYLPIERIKVFTKSLKATTRSLGGVRDLDVFRLNIDLYIHERSSWREEAYKPLMDLWLKKHNLARQDLVSYLEGSEYLKFVGDLSKFLNKFEKWNAGITEKHRESCVYQIVPSVIYNLDKNVRVIGKDLHKASLKRLHELRIELKKYRYTLEFFESVLGNSCRDLIEEIIRLQDHLGDLNDASFALHLVRSQIDKEDPDQIHNRASEQYALYLEKRIATLRESFPGAWEQFNRPTVREQLAAAVAAL